MNQKYEAPEVFHLKQAVKSVKEGLLPERQSYKLPQQIDIDRDEQEETEEPEE